jgi:hypothetical protein
MAGEMQIQRLFLEDFSTQLESDKKEVELKVEMLDLQNANTATPDKKKGGKFHPHCG